MDEVRQSRMLACRYIRLPLKVGVHFLQPRTMKIMLQFSRNPPFVDLTENTYIPRDIAITRLTRVAWMHERSTLALGDVPCHLGSFIPAHVAGQKGRLFSNARVTKTRFFHNSLPVRYISRHPRDICRARPLLAELLHGPPCRACTRFAMIACQVKRHAGCNRTNNVLQVGHVSSNLPAAPLK